MFFIVETIWEKINVKSVSLRLQTSTLCDIPGYTEKCGGGDECTKQPATENAGQTKGKGTARLLAAPSAATLSGTARAATSRAATWAGTARHCGCARNVLCVRRQGVVGLNVRLSLV